MASQQQSRKQSTTGKEEAAQGHQGQAMSLEEIGKYRAEAQQRSADAIRGAEERLNKANQQAGRAHGTTTVAVVSHQAGANQAAKHQQEELHGHEQTEAQQWLADAASDARERCNRAMGMGTNPTAAQEQSYAGSTAKETKKSPSSTEHEGGGQQAHGQLTRQEEMGHGRQPQKLSDAEAAVEKHNRSKHATAGQGQQQSAKDKASHAVGATAEHAKAKDAGARGARAASEKTQEATGTAVDYTKQTVWKAKDATASAAGTATDYAKQAAVKAKDVTASTGSTAAEYAKTAAVKAKDVTAGTGATAAEYAKAAAEKAKEAAVATAKTTAGYTQVAAVKAKDVTVAAGATVAQKATEVTADVAHRVAEYAREKAEQGKEAAARAEEPGDEKAQDKARDVTGTRRQEDTVGSGDVTRRAEQGKEKVKGAAGAVAQKAGDVAGRVKDTAKDAAGGVEQRSRETAAQAGDKARDTASHAEQKAGEAKHRAKGGDVDAEGGTTVIGDVLEAVGATVVGLAQHAKGIVAGEEELVPGDVLETAESKVAGGAKQEEKRKTA